MDINLRIAGEAGQGVVALGEILVGALTSAGLQVLTCKSYMSRVRGGLNWSDIRAGDCDLHGLKVRAELLAALTPEALDVLRDDVSPGGIILADSAISASEDVISIDFSGISSSICGSAIMANTAAAGAIFALLGYEPAPLKNYLQQVFAKKGDETVQNNLKSALAGYNAAAGRQVRIPAPAPGTCRKEYLTSGAAAIGLSAAVSGVKLATAYPMTPGTGTFTYLASVADKYGIVVEQAEDEIAAVNMVCGAVYAGVPAMTMTSGGGFALMCEGLSLAGMMELPVFILLAQRPAPATGMP
ncbi:MAG: 2-oxoacid:acceptor oxidoreductase family protein, partial [Victivallaceae bacterium]